MLNRIFSVQMNIFGCKSSVHVNSERMNLLNLNYEWTEELENSDDLSMLEKEYIAFSVRWFETWSLTQDLELNRITARRFWKEAVLRKPRASWQLERWAIGIRWYLDRVESDLQYSVQPVRVAA